MNKNLIVEIFVPTANSKGKKGAIATGYPVAKDLILTARHALYPKDRDEDYPIEIRWRYPGVDQSKWWTVENIAWEGGEAYDVALIKSAFPEVVEGRGSLSETKPHDNMTWVSEGFAKAGGKDDGVRRTVPMKGGVFSASDTAKTFQLHNEAPPDDETGWQGASGSPVFINQWIIGVVVTCPGNFNAARLQATPMWQLLQDELFRKTIGFDDTRNRRRQFEKQLIKVLRHWAQAVKALTEQIVDLGYEIPVCEEEQRTHCLVGRLLDLDIEDAIEVCKDAHKSLFEEDSLGDAQAISRAIQLILPAIYDFGVVETVRSRKFDISTALVALPAGIRTVAEIIMAGVDRRQTEYRSIAGDEHLPEGSYSLPSMPEMGFDPEGDALKDAWHTQFIDRFRPESAQEFRNAWHNYMTKKFVDTEARARRRTPEELIMLAADELEHQAEKEGKTYYFIVDMPANATEVEPENQQMLMSLIRELKAHYPAVVFLSLSNDFNLERRERKRYRSLRPMLPCDGYNPQSSSNQSRSISTIHRQDDRLWSVENETMQDRFDVFLCHNSEDKPEVKKIGNQLKDNGLHPWLDEWELRPGFPWQRLLEENIEKIEAAAVFVGQSGIGPWQQMEMEAYLRQFVNRKCPVIPVILKGTPKLPKLPLFLEGLTWVDFRQNEPVPLERLIWGITGERSGSRVTPHKENPS